jgi:ribosomal protein S18 acetylase RimI-like enzyme
MKIQPIKSEDHDGIMRLYKQFNEDRISSGVGDASYKYLRDEMPWEQTLNDKECVTLAAKEKSMILGFITVRMPQFNPFDKIGKLGEVDLIVVERKLRKRGVGKAMYKVAERHMKALGVTHVLLNVKVGNLSAMNFWPRMGFKKVSDTSFQRMDGGVEKTFYMVKKI